MGKPARAVALALAALVAVGCTPEQPQRAPVADSPTTPVEPGTLEWAVEGPWRFDAERDVWRHPLETLSFFGIENDMHVVEVYPGQGWYTTILAPYLARGGGRLTVATFDPRGASASQVETLEAFRQRFADTSVFGTITFTVLSPQRLTIAEPGGADMVLVFRNVHTLMAQGFAPEAFQAFYAALRPGGVLGVEQHRAPPGGLQDPVATSGYVQQDYVVALAQQAGFVLEEASEINANPADTADHPFGVWTLPPVLRTAPIGQPDDPAFDVTQYRQIGESDRMTLRFRKPR